MGSPEDRAEDVGGIIHYKHIQLYVRVLRRCLSKNSAEICRMPHSGVETHSLLLLRPVFQGQVVACRRPSTSCNTVDTPNTGTIKGRYQHRRPSRPEELLVQVPDLHQAYIFYCDGLGFTQDPGTWSKQRGGFKVLWFNLGRHQVDYAPHRIT